MSIEQTTALTGGCQCGAVRYRLTAQPIGSVCHCRMCQKAVGGPFAALGAVDVAALTWTRGAPALFASSSIAQRGFCADCGTPLTYQGLGNPRIEMTLGSLDDPGAVQPVEQNGSEGRLAWLASLADLPATPTESEYETLANHQHPDHDT